MGGGKLWNELKRRGVFRAAAAYLITGWLVLEVGHVLSVILELPHLAMKFVLALLMLGFPVVLAAAWMYRFTADGFVPDLPETDPAAKSEHDKHDAGGHGGGHGGHGGGGADPLPVIVGVGALVAVLLLGAIKILGIGDGAEHAPTKGAATHGAEPAVPAVPTPPDRAAHGATIRPAASPAPTSSIAVLPFANLSGDPAQQYFSDGLSAELLDKLAGIGRLQVAARTSSFSFRNTNLAVGEIAQRLGVAYVLDGSVRRGGNVVRVSAQLIDARTGFERWSQSYDREMKDIFAVQSGIASAVAEALKVRLLGDDIAALSLGGTTNPAALDAYLRGRRLVDRDGDEAEWRQALAAFDRAIAIDPNYAAAHAARANTLAAIGNAFAKQEALAATFDAANAAAERAVELAPDLPQAQSALGFARLFGRLNFRAAAGPYARAMQHGGGGDADLLIRYGLFAVRKGDIAPGLAALRRAAALDPLNPSAHKALGSGLIAARQYRAAMAPLTRALALNPATNLAHGELGKIALQGGELTVAVREFDAESIGWSRLSGLAIAEHRRGNAVGAQAALARLIRDNGDSALYQQAQVRAQWGDAPAALAALEGAYRLGDAGLVYLGSDALLDPLRREPRFIALLARLGLGAR